MKLNINGEPGEAPDGSTVAELLEQLEIRTKGVAVERNGEVIPRASHAETKLAEGDTLEVVTLVGGG
jgi:sulfur carrier protein